MLFKLDTADWDVRCLGRVAYAPCFAAMKSWTQQRATPTAKTLWLCEHDPVYTLGLAGKIEHLLGAHERLHIPVVQTDRGGQVTYHGPGQALAYPLLHLPSQGYLVKEYVFRLEDAVLRCLAHFGVVGHRVREAPGIYVHQHAPFAHRSHHARPLTVADLGRRMPDLAKIAALGIKISHKGAYHGVALNVEMNLSPFHAINPCGYVGLAVTDLAHLGVHVELAEVQRQLARFLLLRL